jgi:hypothetical protein
MVHNDDKRFGEHLVAGARLGCGACLLQNLPNLGSLGKSSVTPIVFSDDWIKIDAQ